MKYVAFLNIGNVKIIFHIFPETWAKILSTGIPKCTLTEIFYSLFKKVQNFLLGGQKSEMLSVVDT
jgi:hypothetical protein